MYSLLQDTIELLIQIRHSSIVDYLVDNLLIQLPRLNITGTFSKQYTVTSTSRTTAEIALSFNSTCSANFYGPHCSEYCLPTPRHRCNENGQQVCKDNFYNLPGCSTQCTPSQYHVCDSTGNRLCSQDFFIPPSCSEECIPRDDLTGHYRCLSNGSRTCLDGYYGDNCAVACEEEMGRSTCDGNGTLVCEDGYYGDNCNVYCVPRRDSGGHYDCDSSTGLKVCLKGFENPTTNCTQRELHL